MCVVLGGNIWAKSGPMAVRDSLLLGKNFPNEEIFLDWERNLFLDWEKISSSGIKK